MRRRIAATLDRLLHHVVRVEVRAVDDEGSAPDLLMELGRDSWSAIKLLTNLIMNLRIDRQFPFWRPWPCAATLGIGGRAAGLASATDTAEGQPC
jgi:hypothetical protein